MMFGFYKHHVKVFVMKEFKVDAHEPSLLPEGFDWKLVWSDEFDGPELDRSKWDFRLNYWGRPFSGYTDQGIKFDGNSNIELHRTERDGYYVSPQLQTGSNSFDIPSDNPEDRAWKDEKVIWKLGKLSKAKFVHRFGYYECRCKFQKHTEDMWSAFWLQSPSIGTSFDPTWCGIESDIMECFKEGYITAGNIMGGYGSQFRQEGRIRDYKLKETADGFHRFGMHWSPNGYVFYCDGEEISRASENVSFIPQFILLTTEVKGHRGVNPEPRKVGDVFVDDAFIVDYVRVFDEV